MEWVDKLTLKKITQLHRKFIKVESGCWEHTYNSTSSGHGYARVSFGRAHREYLHRVFFYIYNGDYPQTAYICHNCDNQKCINPSHMYQGNAQTNLKDVRDRGLNPTWDKTHCINGHEFTSANTYLRKTKTGMQRNCRKCVYRRTQAWRKRKRLQRDN